MHQTFYWPDFILWGIIAFSIVVSFFRGFVREFISLISWVMAAWFAFMLAKPLSSWMTFTKIESLQILIAFLLVFICLVFLGALVNFVVGKIIRKTPFSLPDRIIGLGFGLTRGVIIVTLVILIAGLTPLPKDQWWQHSFTIQTFQVVAKWVQGFLPDSYAKHFDFSPKEKEASQKA